MLPTGIQVVLALLLAMPSPVMALLAPRQTAFSNNTSTPTSTSGQATAIPTPPPCCWIVIGDFAVGYASWYSSTAEQVVGSYKSLYPVYFRGLTGSPSHCCNDLLPREQWHRACGALYHDTEGIVGISSGGHTASRGHVRTQDTWCTHRPTHGCL